MAKTDIIKIPVSLQPDDKEIKQVSDTMRQIVEGAFTDVDIKLFGPNLTRKIEGVRKLQSGKYAKFKASARLTPTEDDPSKISIYTDVSEAKPPKPQKPPKFTAAEERLRAFKKSIQFQPLDDKIKEIGLFLYQYGDINNELTDRIGKLGEKRNQRDLRNLKRKLVGRSPASQLATVRAAIKNQEVFADDGDLLLKQLKKKFGNLNLISKQSKFKQFRQKVSTYSPETQITAYENLLNTAKYLTNEMRLTAQTKIDKLKAGIGNRKFRKQRVALANQDIDQQIQGWQHFINAIDPNNEAAKSEFRRVLRQKQRQQKAAATKAASQQRTAERQAFSDTATNLTGKDLRDQIHGWRDYIKSGGTFVQKARARIRSLRKQEMTLLEQSKKERYRTWEDHVRSITDSNAQIAEIDKYLAGKRPRYADRAKALKNRIQRVQKADADAKARERQRGMSNSIMVAAGAGLGILGPAGFPLLNVGFAAMSGGVGGAAIVGAATAIGELSRAIIALKDSAVSTAKEIGFVPKGLKYAEARMQGLEAFTAIGAMSVQQANIQAKLRDLKDYGRFAVYPNMAIEAAQGVPGRAMREAIFNPQRLLSPSSGGLPGFLFDVFKNSFSEGKGLLAENADSALTSFRRQMSRSTVGIENDPYQSWLRIQNSVLDPTKQTELELQRQTLRWLEAQVEALKGNTEALKELPTSGGGGAF